MPLTRESELVAFDADACVAAIREATPGVRLVVEYTDESFRTLYADDATLSLFGDREAMREYFESVHDYVGIDFAERELFEDTLRAAGGVRAITTHMDRATVVRVLVGETQGLFVSVDPDTPVTELVACVEETVAETADETEGDDSGSGDEPEASEDDRAAAGSDDA